MTTIQQVRKNVIDRKAKAEAERIARERATANSVELLLERANINAVRSMALASILAPMNETLSMIAAADATNHDITLEQAGSMHKAFDLFDQMFAPVFEAIDNGLVTNVKEDGAETDGCCAVIDVPTGATANDLVASLLRVAAGRQN